ncbi:histidine kinase [Paucibacter aquatile]|uniref:Virulence sensor protein BvgS n=1 Tax=Kinneretia aquatilis TaxID=2070761 RepID=A0A2N8KY79_9BURK|nr:CHASE2 domain-containing protein [Paucibacter aquatile]PND38407.1 histidine kinase [Paucibacter aquatile]
MAEARARAWWRWGPSCLALPLALCVVLFAQGQGPLRPLDLALEDSLLRLTAQPLRVDELALLDIDDDALREMQPALGDWPYPRSVYALLLDYLQQAGARRVVIDLVLSGEREGDAELARALQQGPPSVLAAAGLQLDAPPSALPREELTLLKGLAWSAAPPGTPSLSWNALMLPAMPLLREATAALGRVGLVSSPLDSDGLLRRQPLWHRYQGQVLPALPLAVLLQEQPERLQSLQTWPLDAQGRVQLKLPSRLEGLPELSWGRLMRAALGQREDPGLRESLRGRTVFVGSSAYFADAVSTPQGRLSGSAFVATAAALLARGQVLASAGWAWAAVLLLLAAVPGVLHARSRAMQAQQRWGLLLGSTALSLTLLLGLAVWLVQSQLLLPSLLGPLATLALALMLAGLAEQRWQSLRHRELRHAREVAEAANQAKTQFLAHVSHEIRTPMNAVLGMAEILARTELNAEQRRYVQVFQGAGQQLFALINDLLDNAKIEAGKLSLAPHAFHLGELLRQQIDLQQGRARERGLSLELCCADEIEAWVWGDAQRLAQVLANLLSNAIKFTRQGDVRLEVRRLEPGRWSLAVQDSGIGIPPAMQERIFQPYTQADASISREYGGTGLGLAISRSLVQMMGGRLSLSSVPGQGSRFELNLPLPAQPAPAPGELPPAPAASAPLAPRRLRPLRLLLCEDNEVNVLVIEAMLAPLGHAIEVAGDGEQALACLQRGAYDLVLMDVQMPVLDGLEVTRRWRAIEAETARPRLAILALTANAFARDVEQCLAAGCDAHLSKPIALQALEQALERWALPLEDGSPRPIQT